jgi:hypothetical protein
MTSDGFILSFAATAATSDISSSGRASCRESLAISRRVRASEKNNGNPFTDGLRPGRQLRPGHFAKAGASRGRQAMNTRSFKIRVPGWAAVATGLAGPPITGITGPLGPLPAVKRRLSRSAPPVSGLRAPQATAQGPGAPVARYARPTGSPQRAMSIRHDEKRACAAPRPQRASVRRRRAGALLHYASPRPILVVIRCSLAEPPNPAGTPTSSWTLAQKPSCPSDRRAGARRPSHTLSVSPCTTLPAIRSQQAGADPARAREERARLAARDAIQNTWNTVRTNIALWRRSHRDPLPSGS